MKHSVVLAGIVRQRFFINKKGQRNKNNVKTRFLFKNLKKRKKTFFTSIDNNRLQLESEERRNKVKVKDRLRVKNERLTDIEEEQRFKNDTLQRKAMMQLQENEEEIKRLNQVRTLPHPSAKKNK